MSPGERQQPSRRKKAKLRSFFAADSEIDCFECNTWDDPRCGDPFNYSIYPSEMPPIRKCGGCCVKMVQFIGTGAVSRTSLKNVFFKNMCVLQSTTRSGGRARTTSR